MPKSLICNPINLRAECKCFNQAKKYLQNEFGRLSKSRKLETEFSVVISRKFAQFRVHLYENLVFVFDFLRARETSS